MPVVPRWGRGHVASRPARPVPDREALQARFARSRDIDDPSRPRSSPFWEGEECRLARPLSVEDRPSVRDVDVCVFHHGHEGEVLDEGEVIDSFTR